jgi:putative flippase GtrA
MLHPAARAHVFQFLRYCVVGALCTLIHVAVFLALCAALDTSAVLANLAAHVTALTVNTALSFAWTFRQPFFNRNGLRKAAGFWAVSLTSFVLNSAFAWAIVDRMALSPNLAALMMVTVTPVVTYGLNAGLVFRRRLDPRTE